MDRTDSKIDAPLTQPRSGVVRGEGAKAWVVLHRLMWGPFSSAAEADKWAEKKWPGEDHDVQALCDPATE